MTRDEVKDLIVKTVEMKQGCKVTGMLIELLKTPGFSEVVHDEMDFVTFVDDLVDDRRLVEVEYKLASIPYRSKSFLLPAKTEVLVYVPPGGDQLT